MPTGVPFTYVVITDPLISLSDAKDQLRITDDTHDAEVQRTVLAAQNVILQYLKQGADPAWTETTLPYQVRAAIQLLLTHLYEDRGDRARETDADADEKVWDSIDRLLARSRDPALGVSLSEPTS